MRLVIAGGRDMNVPVTFIAACVDLFFLSPNTIIQGEADGVDASAKRYAIAYKIPHEDYKADWSTHGKAAGPMRNERMAKAGDALLLVWDGKSPGSASMKRAMEALNKPIYEVILKKNEDAKQASFTL